MKINSAHRLLATSVVLATTFPTWEQLDKKLKQYMSEDRYFIDIGEAHEMFPKARFSDTKGYYKFLVQHFQTLGPVYRLYRTLDRLKGFKALSNPANKLGVHWSDQKINTAFFDKGSFVVCATAKSSSIDWMQTFVDHFTLPYEREFRLKGPVHVVGILDAKGNVVWENPDKTNMWRTA